MVIKSVPLTLRKGGQFRAKFLCSAHRADSAEPVVNKTLSTFVLITVLTGLLAALSIALQAKGYGFGALGTARLDAIASAATFIPLAALYALSGALMVILPLRAAGFIYINAAAPIHAAALALFATILGVQLARFAFGSSGALWTLVDWQFLFAVAIVAMHFFLNATRSNALIRTVFFLIFIAATLACVYWTFRL